VPRLELYERDLVLEALEDILREVESPDVCALVSQRAVDKVEQAVQILKEGMADE
jgi:hypothetical protein